MSAKKISIWGNIIPAAVAFILTFIILLFFRFLPSKLPLFYSLPWGDQQLATKQQFFIIPALIILIALINFIVSWYLHSAQLFFKRILLTSTLVSTIILAITFVKIVLIFV